MKDLYIKVDADLVNNNYWNVSISEKKNLIDECLKKYIIEKIQELKPNMLSQISCDMDLIELFKYFASLFLEKEHSNTIAHFTHYILGICSNLQSWSITWWQEDDETLIENPVVDFNIDGKWDKLTTHLNTDYVKLFEFVYSIFKKNFMLERKDEKRLELIADSNY